MTEEYLFVIFTGIIFVFIYNFFAAVLRSVGNTLMPLIFLIVACAVNIALDIFFIASLNMGVMGAALATVIAQAISAILIVLYYYKRERNLSPAKKHFVYHKKIISAIIHNSTLTAVQQSIMNLGILAVQGLVNSFGLVVSAAFAAVVKIDAFAYMPAQDFGNVFSIYTAQNYGAKNAERIRKGLTISLMITSAFCLAASAVVYIFAEPLMQFFVKATETEVIRISIQYLRIEGAFYVGIGILFIWYGYFRGISKAGHSIILTITSLGIRVVLAFILARTPLGLIGIWISVPIGWFIADILGALLYWQGTKKRSLIFAE